MRHATPCAAPPLTTRVQARGGVRANATTGNVKQVRAPCCLASCLLTLLTCSFCAKAFLLDESLSASTSQELAWATFGALWHVLCTRSEHADSSSVSLSFHPALLTTTNASCAVLVRDGAVACARGTLSAAALAGGLGGLAATLAPAVARVRADGTGAVQVRRTACLFATMRDSRGPAAQYFADSPPFPGMAEAFSARSALVLPLARSGDFLLVCATAPRAFDAKARAVASSLATKLSTAFADK